MDGKKVAGFVEDILKKTAQKSKHAPRLGILISGGDPASIQYVNKKKEFGERIGCTVRVVEFGISRSESELMEEIARLSDISDGVIVQLPLPKKYNSEKVQTAIPQSKDVDVLSPSARDSFVEQLSGSITPPVPLAILALLIYYGVDVKGRQIAVVGRGKLVGEPTIIVMEREGANVEFIDKETEGASATEIIRKADIVITGIGVPHFIKSDMVGEGAVVIDAGTSEASGKIVGDVDPAVSQKASLFAPVPGGVGPLTVAMLFVNLFTLAGLVDSTGVLLEIKKKANI